ncbi:hypothetical protein NE237_029049 [Protea cynaroides]|uniref:Uncharacterized protein n=1 Tax=Protea cynaroides TaxID=273540 RepID=A0A9Q0JUQ3_9MAGN|nr:hypothetical protein NE237_029049 [Protea cynaroides]
MKLSRTLIQDGIEHLPLDVRKLHKYYLDKPVYKMILPIKPKSGIRMESSISVSVIIGRRDINKFACIFVWDKLDNLQGYAPNFFCFASTISGSILKICTDSAFVSLLFMLEQLLDNADSLHFGDIVEIRGFGVVLDFGDDVLLVLRILVWD